MKRSLTLLAILFAFVAVMVVQAPEVRSAPATPIKEMIGVNAVVNNSPSDLAKVVGWIRDYHKWYWYEATKDVYSWSTGWQKLDSFYGTLKAAGVKVMPDVEFAPGWASSNGQTDGVPDAAQHAEYLRELVRHYGDTIAAVENFNEPNQTWQPVRFPANVFGAMTGQDYDAVKAADPRMPVVLAGMAGPDTTYLETATQASGGKFDVVNFHWYAEGDTVVGGKNPEAGGLFEAIDRVKAWRDAKAPGKPIWITEFGWDTFAQPDGRKSKIYAPETNAANYLLRSIFLMQGRGVEKGFAYIYRDVSDNQTYLHNVYLSSGLVTNNAEKDGRKKAGWYYLATLKGVLGDYVFDRIVSNGPNVYHYEYVLPGTDQRAAVVWARNGIRDNGYRVSYTAPAGTMVLPTDGSTTGTVSQTDGRLTLTERPVFVLYRGAAAPTATALPTQTSAPTATPAATVAPTQTVSPPASSGSNLLLNGGFEGGLSNWFVPAWFAGVTSADGSQVHGGSRALKFQGSVAGPYSYQEVSASPGQKVDFSGWVNVPELNGDMSMIVDLVPRHQYNGDLPVIRLASISKATGGWVQISGSGVMPDRTAKVRLMIRFPRLNGAAYLDDLSLRTDGSSPAPTATPAPTNPPATPTAAPTNPPATPTPVPTQPTVVPTQPPATPTLGPTQPPAGSGALANTPWPSYGQNALRNNRSPYVGPQQQPRVKWSFNRTGDHWGTDYRGTGIGQNGTMYIAAGMTGVYALDSASGQMKWLWVPENTGHETWIEFPPTVAPDGTLYVSSENDYLYALSKDGKVLWKFLSDHLHTPVSISPDGTTLHFISENGFIYALNRGDGSLKWKYQLGNKVYATGRRIPVVYDEAGNLYFSWISSVFSMTANGQMRWSVNVGNKGPYMVGPAVSDDGTLYFVYVQNLFAIGMDGKLKWQYALGKSAFDRTPTIGADGTVYIGAEDGFIYALNPNGTLKWKQQYANTTGWGGGIKSNILIDARGTLYFLTKDREVLAVNSSTRQVLWRYSTGYGDNSYPGIQLSLDSDGTLYSPVNEGVAVALTAGTGGVAPIPASSSTPQPSPTVAPTKTATPAPTATPVPTVAPTPGPIPSGSILWGSWVGSAVNVAGNEAAFEQAVNKPRAIRHWYWSVAPISQSASSFAAWSSAVPAGSVLMLSWAPSPQDSTLDNVNAGKHDGYITEWAKALKAYGREVWLRPMWEDNGSWYWWSSGPDWDTNKKNKFKSAYQRVVKLFRQEGAGNVKFIWSPNVSGTGAGTAKLSYPGADYVDLIGLDGYPMRGGRGDFYSTFKPDYDALGTLGKPMIVAETGVNIWADAERAQYVANLLGYELPTRFPKFSAFVWFNEPGWGDLLDPNYPLTLEAFRKGIGIPYFKGR